MARTLPRKTEVSGFIAYRVMSSEEFENAAYGRWEDGYYVKGDPDEVGRKWLWLDFEGAERWQAYVAMYEDEGVIAEVDVKRPLGQYERYPHDPQGVAIHVPFADLGRARKV
jgi:hypothetical protein